MLERTPEPHRGRVVAVADLPAVPGAAGRSFILPGIAWFALIGLAVPAAMVERLGFRDALVRGRQLGIADYVHALGSLAALVVVVGVAETTLSALLHCQGDNGQRVARRHSPTSSSARCSSSAARCCISTRQPG